MLPKKNIILEPLGGLGNRMRVISSALWLKEHLNCKISVIWNEDEHLNANFYFLFQSISDIEIIQKLQIYNYLKHPSKYHGLKKVFFHLTNILSGSPLIIDDNYIYNQIRIYNIDLLGILKKYQKVYFKTCEHFGDAYKYIEVFEPTPQIKEKINSLCIRFSEHTIGIHIRRTDHTVSIENSPVDMFIHTMNSEISINPDISFFLSTDDENTESVLLDLFKDRIIINKKNFSRSTLSGIQDAIVDMYCLARTSKIYGSYWSSFNIAAGAIGKIDVIQLRKPS